jgi:hypothetical protein
MVRASLAMYSSPEDIRALGSALRDIQAKAGQYRRLYCVDEHGDYRHTGFRPPSAFDVSATIDRALHRGALERRSGVCRRPWRRDRRRRSCDNQSQ